MFFEYRQNNSGGYFEVDDNVTHYVIIEAESARVANARAEDLGIYFDGRGDCGCCGNRWDRAYDMDGTEFPTLYGEPVEEYDLGGHDRWFLKPGDPAIIVHFANGGKLVIQMPEVDE